MKMTVDEALEIADQQLKQGCITRVSEALQLLAKHYHKQQTAIRIMQMAEDAKQSNIRGIKMTMVQTIDFDPTEPFIVYEQPHRGMLKIWICDNAGDFINKVCQYYQHSISFQDFEKQYQKVDYEGNITTHIPESDWDKVRKFIASDMQYCVLVNVSPRY